MTWNFSAVKNWKTTKTLNFKVGDLRDIILNPQMKDSENENFKIKNGLKRGNWESKFQGRSRIIDNWIFMAKNTGTTIKDNLTNKNQISGNNGTENYVEIEILWQKTSWDLKFKDTKTIDSEKAKK